MPPTLTLYHQSSSFDLIDASADTASCERAIIDIVPFMLTIKEEENTCDMFS